MENKPISWKEAGLSNNFMFRLVMEKPELCTQLLERVLDIKINKLEYLEPEKSFEAKLTSKGIRLDLYIEDENGTAYDIEMQTGNADKKDLGKRTRYYQSLMDEDALKKGVLYRKLRKSIIIFICTFDPFDRNFGRYTFNCRCNEDTELLLDDAATRVFINTKGDRHRVTKALANLMDYINDGTVTDNFTKQLNERVTILRGDDGKEALFMTYQQTLLEVEDKGIQKGIQKEKLTNIRSLMDNANWTAKKAMDMLGIPTNEQSIYADMLGVSLQ